MAVTVAAPFFAKMMNKRKIIGYVLCFIAFLLMAWPARSEFDNPQVFDNGAQLDRIELHLQTINNGALNTNPGIGTSTTKSGLVLSEEPFLGVDTEGLSDMPTEAWATRIYVADIWKQVNYLRQAMFWFIGLYLVSLTVHGWRV